jgi:DNA-binding XRE family transcriptional regulator
MTGSGIGAPQMHDRAYRAQSCTLLPKYARSRKNRSLHALEPLICTIMHSEPRVSALIAAEVRRARHDQKLRQDELALAAGVSVRSVHQIEAGKQTTRLDVLERVLNALGLTLDVASRRSGNARLHRP